MFKENLGFRDYLYISAILVMFFITSFTVLNNSALWLDEVSQIFGFKLDLNDLIKWLSGNLKNEYIIRDASPPTYYLIQKLFLNNQVGTESLRYLSTIISAICLPVFYLTLRINFKPHLSAVILLCLATNPVFLQNSSSIRAYPLFLTICVLSIYFLISYFKNNDIIYFRISLILASISATTHFYGLIFISFLVLFTYITKDWIFIKKNLIFIVLCFITTIALVVPLVLTSTDRSLGFVPSSLFNIVFNFLYFTFFHESNSVTIWAIAINIFSLLIVAAINLKIYFSKLSFQKILITILIIIVTLLMAFYIKSFNILKPRYFIWLNLFYFLALINCFNKLNAKVFFILVSINIFSNFYSIYDSSHLFRNSSLAKIYEINKTHNLANTGYIINTGEFISLPLRFESNDLAYERVRYSYKLDTVERDEFLKTNNSILCITQRRRIFNDLISFKLNLVDTCMDLPKEWDLIYKGIDINRKAVSLFTLYSKPFKE